MIILAAFLAGFSLGSGILWIQLIAIGLFFWDWLSKRNTLPRE